MANITLNDSGLTLMGAGDPATDDIIPIWDASASQQKRVTRANLVGSNIQGGGSIVTGGYTLTIPATGTAALIEEAKWAPTLLPAGGSITLDPNYNSASYVKIGRLVFVNGQLNVASVSSPTGTVKIGNLPYPISNEFKASEMFSFAPYVYGISVPYQFIGRYGVGDDAPVLVYWSGTAWTASGPLWQAGAGLLFSFFYLTLP